MHPFNKIDNHTLEINVQKLQKSPTKYVKRREIIMIVVKLHDEVIHNLETIVIWAIQASSSMAKLFLDYLDEFGFTIS